MNFLERVLKQHPEATFERRALLEINVGTATAAWSAALDDVEQAYLEKESGGLDRTTDATAILHRAEWDREKAQRTLDAHIRVAEKQHAEMLKACRAASWQGAVELAEMRIADAKKLAELVHQAGTIYEGLISSGYRVHQSMPGTSGPPSNHLLSESSLAGGLAVDIAKAGLPDQLRVSPSVLDQYPDVVKVVTGALSCVEAARRIDESAA